jgi:hypothetical protein
LVTPLPSPRAGNGHRRRVGGQLLSRDHARRDDGGQPRPLRADGTPLRKRRQSELHCATPSTTRS